MKVLIITYYWPPAGGSGVQRWLKFVKYLSDFDIEPVVYTVNNPCYAIEDKSLEKDLPEGIEILKQAIWEPNNLLGKRKQTSAGFLSTKPSLFGKIAQYIRANYFIPDARKYWIRPSVKFLLEYLKNNKVDVVISTGPPHSIHLIGLELKNKLGIKWISDFRDPWTDIDYFHQLPLTEKSLKKHQQLERAVLNNSDAVIVVGETMKRNYEAFNTNIHVITNGFDTPVLKEYTLLDEKFSITHIGLMNDDRNPVKLWKVLSELSEEEEGFSDAIQIKLIGKVSNNCLHEIKAHNLETQVELIDYLPHAEVQRHQKTAQLLLLALNDVPSAKGIITGKIFEYLVANRPILAIGPVDGDLASILKDTNAGVIIDFNNEVSLKSTILEFYKQYKTGDLKIDSVHIEQYHRRRLTERLSQIIKGI